MRIVRAESAAKADGWRFGVVVETRLQREIACAAFIRTASRKRPILVVALEVGRV